MPLLNVVVNAEDIENGARSNSWLCPLCRALWRLTGIRWVVEETTCFPITNPNAFIPLPWNAISWTAAFDGTGMGQPFEFELEVPRELRQ